MLPESDSNCNSGKRAQSASATFWDPFVSMFMPMASPALAFSRMWRRLPETKQWIDYAFTRHAVRNFHLAVLRRGAERRLDEIEPFRRLHKRLHLCSLEHGDALEHWSTRHAVRDHHGGNTATRRNGSSSSVRAGDERSFRGRHRNEVLLAVHENGSHHTYGDGNVANDGFAVVALQITLRCDDYGHPREEWRRVPSVGRDVTAFRIYILLEQELTTDSQRTNRIGQERLQFVNGHFLLFYPFQNSAVRQRIEGLERRETANATDCKTVQNGTST